MAQLWSLGIICTYENFRQDIFCYDRYQPSLILDYLGFAHGSYAAYQLIAAIRIDTITTIILAEPFHELVCGVEYACVFDDVGFKQQPQHVRNGIALIGKQYRLGIVHRFPNLCRQPKIFHRAD